MSSKRALTGGTGDVNPQAMVIVASQLAANGTYNNSIQLPINRYTQGSRRSTIMEILRVETIVDVNNLLQLNSTGTQVAQWQVQLATKSQTAVNAADPTVFYVARDQVNYFQPATATALAVHMAPMPQVRDYTDGAGHGLLIATDNIYVIFNTTAFNNVSTAYIRIYYRFKEVSLEEYIGIVQSQQS